MFNFTKHLFFLLPAFFFLISSTKKIFFLKNFNNYINAPQILVLREHLNVAWTTFCKSSDFSCVKSSIFDISCRVSFYPLTVLCLENSKDGYYNLHLNQNRAVRSSPLWT
jgi:hypothetical protein